MNATEAAVSTLLLGRDGDWWDKWMLISLGVAALVAAFVVAFTTGSVKVHKREATAASDALAKYKLETAKKVADATRVGIAAGEKAARAQQDVDAAQVKIANAQTEAAVANRRAAEASSAADAERIKRLELEASLKPRRLSAKQQEDLAALLKNFSAPTIGLEWTGPGGNESADLAADFESAIKAGNGNIGGK